MLWPIQSTSIISLAVEQLLGHKPIQSLDDADDLVTAAEQAFDILLPSVLSTGNWRFSIQIQQLVLFNLNTAFSNQLDTNLFIASGLFKKH